MPPDAEAAAEEVGAAEAERLVREAEFGARSFGGRLLYATGAVAVAWSGFQLWTAAFGTLPGVQQRAVHLAFGLALCFIFYPVTRRVGREGLPAYDVVLALLGAWSAFYVYWFHAALVRRVGDPTTLDIITGVLCVLFILEATRRTVGWILPLITACFIGYAFLGPLLPLIIAHRGYTVRRVVDHLYLTTEGIFGIPLWVSSTFVFAFVLFGAILDQTGIGEYLIKLAFSLFGGTRGGPAKAAVVASAFMGTISGSSIANAATTGNFTIPLMKRVGYAPETAAGIETAASGNGQLMPPIMGAAAFVMAEWLRIPYLEVIKAAVLPAVIDQLALLGAVHLLALKHGIRGLPREELPRFWATFLSGIHYLIPVGVLLWALIWAQYTPLTAAFYAIVAAATLYVVAGTLRNLRGIEFSGVKGEEVSGWAIGGRLVRGLYLGARTMAGVAATTASAGIIVGVVTLTGIGLNLSNIVVELAGSLPAALLAVFPQADLFTALGLTMLASLVLGMGVPTTATYIIMATLTAPAITLMAPAIPVIAAHLFVFYFGILADDTPPVGLAAYAAAGIARCDPLKAGIQAFKLDMRTFLLPYMFITAPQMLLIDTTPWEAGWIFVTASIGMYGLAAAMQGFLITEARLPERFLLFAAALALVKPGLYTDMAGLGLMALVYLLQRYRVRGQAVPWI